MNVAHEQLSAPLTNHVGEEVARELGHRRLFRNIGSPVVASGILTDFTLSSCIRSFYKWRLLEILNPSPWGQSLRNRYEKYGHC